MKLGDYTAGILNHTSCTTLTRCFRKSPWTFVHSSSQLQLQISVYSQVRCLAATIYLAVPFINAHCIELGMEQKGIIIYSSHTFSLTTLTFNSNDGIRSQVGGVNTSLKTFLLHILLLLRRQPLLLFAMMAPSLSFLIHTRLPHIPGRILDTTSDRCSTCIKHSPLHIPIILLILHTHFLYTDSPNIFLRYSGSFSVHHYQCCLKP